MTAFLARRGNRDFTDIEHLVMTYPNEIRAFANQLDPEAVSFLLTYRPRWGPISSIPTTQICDACADP